MAFTPIGKAFSKRLKESFRLDRNLTPRQANRAHERTMAFLNTEGYFVNATALVDKEGIHIDHTVQEDKLDLILDEMKKLNKTLEFLMEVF